MTSHGNPSQGVMFMYVLLMCVCKHEFMPKVASDSVEVVQVCAVCSGCTVCV